MTQEVNNEMDLLLRRLSRSASDSSSDGNHLDADELSSYAENALPAAARARYTEHLAECASCRKLVAQLSSSIGAVSVTETAKVSAPSALRKFLASLLSPMVLRYAVPALGLIVVAVIGLTVLRRNERADSVAQLVEQKERQAPAAQSSETPPFSSGLINNNIEDKQEKMKAPAGTAADRSERSKEAPPAPPPANAPSSANATVDASQTAPVTKQEQQQPVANEPPAPKPTPAADENQKKIEAEARKQESQVGTGADKENAYTPSTAEARRIDDMAVARRPTKAPGPASMAKVQRDRSEEKDKSDADTRSVAGRRFRREHGIWIDTAYDSSRSTFSLTRGSEQYRSLVADEPAIKTIAEQLDGEIIVVWKGRAYHIQ
jgi:hypothetical protein